MSENVRSVFVLKVLHCVASSYLLSHLKKLALSPLHVCRVSHSVEKRLPIIVILVVCHVTLGTPTSCQVSLEEARE